MKVYIVVRYTKETCAIEKVFSSRKGAEIRIEKLKKKPKKDITYHIVTKSINGLLEPFGLPSKGRLKCRRMDREHLELMIKDANHKMYIERLEKKLLQLKSDLADKNELNGYCL